MGLGDKWKHPEALEKELSRTVGSARYLRFTLVLSCWSRCSGLGPFELVSIWAGR